MNYSLNVCTPVSFDDGDIFEYLDSLILPTEPTDEEGLDDEAVGFAMNFIKNRLLEMSCMEIEGLALRMENYIYLKRHAPFLYEEIEYNLQRWWYPTEPCAPPFLLRGGIFRRVAFRPSGLVLPSVGFPSAADGLSFPSGFTLPSGIYFLPTAKADGFIYWLGNPTERIIRL